MKCLAIGMNPNYVLSEEERKKRFKKKNSPGELTAEIETQQGKRQGHNSSPHSTFQNLVGVNMVLKSNLL